MKARSLIGVARKHVGGTATALAAAFALGAVALTPTSPASAAVAPTRSCAMGFEVTLGKDGTSPITLLGAMVIDIDSAGRFHGELIGDDGQSLLYRGNLPNVGSRAVVSGRVSGRTIALDVELPDGRLAMGVGSGTVDFDTCDATTATGSGASVAGPAVGPDGMQGDWLANGCASATTRQAQVGGYNLLITEQVCTFTFDGRQFTQTVTIRVDRAS